MADSDTVRRPSGRNWWMGSGHAAVMSTRAEFHVSSVTKGQQNEQ
jgi:hypothetical protein